MNRQAVMVLAAVVCVVAVPAAGAQSLDLMLDQSAELPAPVTDSPQDPSTLDIPAPTDFDAPSSYVSKAPRSSCDELAISEVCLYKFAPEGNDEFFSASRKNFRFEKRMGGLERLSSHFFKVDPEAFVKAWVDGPADRKFGERLSEVVSDLGQRSQRALTYLGRSAKVTLADVGRVVDRTGSAVIALTKRFGSARTREAGQPSRSPLSPALQAAITRIGTATPTTPTSSLVLRDNSALADAPQAVTDSGAAGSIDAGLTALAKAQMPEQKDDLKFAKQITFEVAHPTEVAARPTVLPAANYAVARCSASKTACVSTNKDGLTTVVFTEPSTKQLSTCSYNGSSTYLSCIDSRNSVSYPGIIGFKVTHPVAAQLLDGGAPAREPYFEEHPDPGYYVRSHTDSALAMFGLAPWFNTGSNSGAADGGEPVAVRN